MTKSPQVLPSAHEGSGLAARWWSHASLAGATCLGRRIRRCGRGGARTRGHRAGRPGCWRCAVKMASAEDGQWAGAPTFLSSGKAPTSVPLTTAASPGQPPPTASCRCATSVRDFGADPERPLLRGTAALVRDNCRWEEGGTARSHRPAGAPAGPRRPRTTSLPMQPAGLSRRGCEKYPPAGASSDGPAGDRRSGPIQQARFPPVLPRKDR